MAEYIDRTEFLKKEQAVYCDNCESRKNSYGKVVYGIGDVPCRACRIADVLDDVESFHTADVVPLAEFEAYAKNQEDTIKELVDELDKVEHKYGKWINPRPDSEMCSACGVRFSISSLFAVGGNEEPNFCPNCGADMRESEEEDG